MSFSNLGLTPSLCTPLAHRGYKEPTPVQSASIPVVLEGADLLARAHTGTGKTAAFGLPMIDRLLMRGSRSRTRGPRGLVLVPTRELAVQVHRALLLYGAPVQSAGGCHLWRRHMGAQMQALRRGTDIVVATPGRLIDHMERRTIDLAGVEILVLDEGDRMLDMGFMPALRTILTSVPTTRQTLMFSATFSATMVAPRQRVHARRPSGGRGQGRDGCGHCRASRAPRGARAEARAAGPSPAPGAGGPGARLLQDEARVRQGRRSPRGRRPEGGRHSRWQGPGTTEPIAGRLQGRTSQRARAPPTSPPAVSTSCTCRWW